MFTERLRDLRTTKGLTQQDMADYLSIKRPTYTRYESGTNEPDKDTLVKLAIFFDVTVDYLVGHTDKKSPAPKEQGDITFDEFTYALHGEARDLSEEDKETLLSMARFLKQRKQQK